MQRSRNNAVAILAAACLAAPAAFALPQIPRHGPIAESDDTPTADAVLREPAGRTTPGRDDERRTPLGPVRAARGPDKPVAASGKSGISTLAPLAGVVGLILGAAWLAKRLARRSGSLGSTLGAGGKSPGGILTVLGRYPISRGMTLVLLRVDRRVLLLAQSGGRAPAMSTLCEITGDEDVASIVAKAISADGASAAFRGLVSRAERELETDSTILVPQVPVPGLPADGSPAPRGSSLRGALAAMRTVNSGGPAA